MPLLAPIARPRVVLNFFVAIVGASSPSISTYHGPFPRRLCCNGANHSVPALTPPPAPLLGSVTNGLNVSPALRGNVARGHALKKTERSGHHLQQCSTSHGPCSAV